MGVGSGVAVDAALELELERARRSLHEIEGVWTGDLEAPTFEREQFVSVDELARNAESAWRAAAQQCGREIALHLEEVAVEDADRGLLHQALDNLVRNALEHGRGAVCIELLTDSEQALVTVADEGPGPDVSLAELLGRAAGRDGGRRGRGLRLVADVAAAHRGALRELREPAGWTLQIGLPLEVAVAAG